jgi:hypothetical protein
MAFTLSNVGLRDREYLKFVGAGTGSECPISVVLASGTPIIIGSVSASVDSIYIQSGTSYISSGNIWVQSGTLAINPGSVITIGSLKAPYNMDKSTYAFPTIEYVHHEIHDGAHFFIQGFSVVNSGGNVSFETTTQNGSKWVHMLFNVNSTQLTEFNVFEGATLSGATIMTPVNSNRNANITSILTAVFQPVISGTTPTSGTQIFSSRFGVSGGTVGQPLRGEGGQRAENEIILKSGTTYLWEIKSLSPLNLIDYDGNWYEHTDKEKVF